MIVDVKDEVMGVNPLDSIKSSLNQLEMFHMDFLELLDEMDTDYYEDLCILRDETDRLRSKYSILYSKLLE